jgi:hypothetical protein
VFVPDRLINVDTSRIPQNRQTANRQTVSFDTTTTQTMSKHMVLLHARSRKRAASNRELYIGKAGWFQRVSEAHAGCLTMCRGATSATTACGGHVAVYTRQSLTLTTTLTSKGGVGVRLLMIMYISPPNTVYIGPGRDRHKNTKLSNFRIGAAGGKGGRGSEITAGWPKALEQSRSHPQVEGPFPPTPR